MGGLPLARRAVRGEHEADGCLRDGTEAAAGEQATEAAKPETDGNRHSGHVRRFPKGERSVLKKIIRRAGRREEAAVVREPAVPELRPGKAVAFTRDADATSCVPNSVVVG